MNVLILTPDAVGSTLLQRLITIYMQFHSFDKPVINLHELTNGLIKYYNTKFNQEVLGKPDGKGWGYHQSLEEIVNLLDSVNHYKTSRLAQYHIKNRKDSISNQIPFYQYLNDNFFIITCRRHNVFEHSLSWAITKLTKKLNVYSPDEKVESFYHLYRDQIIVDPQSLIQTLETYKIYLRWCDDHFSVASYFYYDEHLPNIEKYILDLPIFSSQSTRLTWEDRYGISFNNWNKCHYLKGDIGSLALNHPEEFKRIGSNAKLSQSTTPLSNDDLLNFLKSYSSIADESWPKIQSYEDFNQLPQNIQAECNRRQLHIPIENVVSISKNIKLVLPVEHTDFLQQHSQRYEVATNEIINMRNEKIMISGPPIKKQTMLEKCYMIKNINQCLDVYNSWIVKNPEVGNPIDINTVEQFSNREQTYWSPSNQLTTSVDLKTLKFH